MAATAAGRLLPTVGAMEPLSAPLIVLGTALTIVGGLTAAPQAVRTWRLGQASGLSIATCWAALLAMLCWCSYTYSIADWPALAGSIAPGLAWAAVLAGLVWHRHLPPLKALLVTTAVVGLTVALSAVDAAGVVAMLLGCILALPQLRACLRNSDLSGVSLLSWTLLTVENAGWALYGLLSATWLYVPAGLIAAPASAVIALRVLAQRRRAAG